MNLLTITIIGGIIVALFAAALGITINVFSKRIREANLKAENANIENTAMKHGIKGLLRNSLIRTCHDSTDKGYAPLYVRDNVTELYKDYEDLKGNPTTPIAFSVQG